MARKKDTEAAAPAEPEAVENATIEIEVAGEHHDAEIDSKGKAVVESSVALPRGRAFKFEIPAGSCPAIEEASPSPENPVPIKAGGRDLSVYLVRRVPPDSDKAEFFAQVA